MHILIASIMALVSLLWALDRFGVDIHSLNPFLWHRRRQWKKKLGTKPIHALKKPIEAAAVLIVGIVQAEGLISREQKSEIINIFRNEFQKDQDTASDMFGSASFLLKDIMDIAPEVPQILALSKDYFSERQILSLLKILNYLAALEGELTQAQRDIIDAVEKELRKEKIQHGEW